jgi:hypothetical protein
VFYSDNTVPKICLYASFLGVVNMLEMGDVVADSPGRNEESSDDEASPDLEWLLGFVEAPERGTDLLRHRFPSKVGGCPAWLDPVHLPSRDQLTCPFTGKVMRFLMQASHVSNSMSSSNID